MQLIDGGIDFELIGPRIKIERGLPDFAVEAQVRQQHAVIGLYRGLGGAASLAMRPANLEQIGKVIVEQDSQTKIDWLIAVIAQPQPLIRGVLPDEESAQNMDAILLHHDALTVDQIGIGQIYEKRGVVVANIGTEQQRRLVIDQHF